MQFFSSAKRTALFSTRPNHPQVLQKNCKFGCITHWLPNKQYIDPAAMNVMSTEVSWGDSFFLHLGKFSVWRLFCPGTCRSWVWASFQHQHWAERWEVPWPSWAPPGRAVLWETQQLQKHSQTQSPHFFLEGDEMMDKWSGNVSAQERGNRNILK